MCNKPLYRIVVNEWVAERLPTKFKARLRGNGVIINRSEFEFFRDILCVPSEFLQTIPCGQCQGCRVDYQNLWSTRIQLECSMHKNNYFITLTYNDEHIKKTPVIDVVTGKVFFYGVIVEKDFQDFMKRLRRYLDYNENGQVKFLSCSEYGDNFSRPHFHFIACGLNLDDLEYFYSTNKKGALKVDYEVGDSVFYKSKKLEDLWGKGFVLISSVSPHNCSYVASYVNKKVTPSEVKKNLSINNFYDLSRFLGKPCAVPLACKMGLMPSSKLNMSRRPGLAFSTFTKEDTEYYSQFGIFPKKECKLFVKRCRYFDSLFEKFDKIGFDLYKACRKRVYYSPDAVAFKQWSKEDLRLCDLREESLLQKMKHKKKRVL